MIEDLFSPRSVAIIGASRNPAKVGHTILRNTVKSGYKGKIYPINPKAKEILGIRCYKSILDVPDEVDLAVIAVPAPAVLNVAKECGEKNVKHLVIISAGFKEIGGEGVDRERKLISIGKKYGMRILGPNCLGFIDTYTPLNVTFAAAMPRKGKIAFISQSGALITAILDWSIRRGIGFSKIISLGNKADLDETDFIRALGRDKNTNVILLYIESIENGLKFIEVARKVSAEKPIIVVKGGITE
ncbi:MAG: CoA-binding protein, partial [Thermoprotei archaeon]